MANFFVEKGLLDDLYETLKNKALYAKVGQILAEVAKSGKFCFFFYFMFVHSFLNTVSIFMHSAYG